MMCEICVSPILEDQQVLQVRTHHDQWVSEEQFLEEVSFIHLSHLLAFFQNGILIPPMDLAVNAQGMISTIKLPAQYIQVAQ